jgi:hypothetical protein
MDTERVWFIQARIVLPLLAMLPGFYCAALMPFFFL